MKLNINDIIVYTVLVGKHEGLNSQPKIKESKIKHVCLTDDINLKSDYWEIIHLDMILPKDNHRSQRNLKIRPHLFFPDYKYSLYIDNTVVLLQKAEEFIHMITNRDDFLENNPFFAIPYHSFRKDLREEFYQCSNLRLDSQFRIYEQITDYFKINKEFFNFKPYWAGILFRNHNNKKLKNLSEIWFANICRYSRRDQLSLMHSAYQANIKLIGFNLDNSSSQFHKWPVKNNVYENKYYDDLFEFFPNELLQKSFINSNKLETPFIRLEKRRNLIYLLFPKLLIKKIYYKFIFLIKKNIKKYFIFYSKKE